MSGPPRILIYAELLSNIRQVSVGCSLPSPCSATTKADVSVDGLTLTIRHEDDQQSVRLPGRVTASQTLPIHIEGALGISWRLPLASAPSTMPLPRLEAQAVPWSANELQAGCAMNCRSCGSVILPKGVVKVWKDLPSENWAEMMEFWHCHKPHSHDHDESAEGDLAGRGYGANSRISAQAGVGFVDLTSFLSLDKDCTNLSTRHPKDLVNSGHADTAPKNRAAVHCSTCNTELGVLHEDLVSATLFKWQLSTSAQPQPSLANCVSSMLMATLARSGCSKSIITPAGDPSPSGPLLHIWLFNSNISFTSTELGGDDSVSAIKVLYRMIGRDEADRISETLTSDVQEISLPRPAVEGTKGLLQQSSALLPVRDRQFKEWTVGLLEKWQGQI
ncbi:hypothetical protein JX265_006248 [Neoarthrinium moseri]|uniref:Ubiquitin-conjugating enzyme E2C-binding protein n=1 Tax=Neoarthrinium moseri TaxID=1658444 RepID=A0A9Q0ALX9_9PEZI|nr:uncharacterized protein JN550_011993 [Neoarthrinium moseri]KAI1841699.1 hypothetical protein JX266_012067 [Neoarthrinium moseri]KAI1859585.1 hypothetical protein JN550_011993 [Neoarthrinium moseri]KAI1870078.1 hypothetical protein JX265_006248 [Neoarthrinium moseri]